MQLVSDVELTADELRLSWSDGEQTSYPYYPLRLACACARCEDEMTGERVLRPDQVARDIIIVDWIRVGNYALQFLWSDGHETGIYPFSQLKRLATPPRPELTTAKHANAQ